MRRTTRINSKSLAPRRGAATRGHILSTAERIFAESGLDGARTEAIAAAAGVNKALLYYYFKGKETLFQAIVEERIKEFHKLASDVLEAKGPTRRILTRYVTTQFDFIGARPYYPTLFQRLLMTGGRPLERLVESYIRPLSRKLIRVIEDGVRRGELRQVDCEHAAISLTALTVFYFSRAPLVRMVGHFDPYQKAQLDRRKEGVLDFIRYALFRNPEARMS